MQRGVGHNALAVKRKQRKHLRVVDIAAPALDQRAVLDMVPGEAAVGDGKVLEKLEQRVDVLRGEGTDQNSAAVAQDGLLRIAMRHLRTIPSRSRGVRGEAEKGGENRFSPPLSVLRVKGRETDSLRPSACSA